MHRDGSPRRQRSRSRSRDRNRRDDRERCTDSRGPHYEVRGGRRADARDRMPDRGQRDDRCDGSGGWAWGPRSGTDDGRGYGGAPQSTGGRQAESQTRHYDLLASHQSRPEAMGMRDLGAWRVESPRRHAEAWEWPHRDELQWRYDTRHI